MNGVLGHLCAHMGYIETRHCPPDTGFEIRALAVRGRARYLSVTEAPHNIESLRVTGKQHILFL